MIEINADKKWANSFIPLKKEICKRLFTPVGQVSFWVSLLVGVLLLGALGIWVELAKLLLASTNDDLDNLRTSIHTFYPAIAFTSTLQLILSAGDKKYLQTAAFAVGISLILLAFMLLAADSKISPGASIFLSSIASVLSVLIWWIANGSEAIFNDGVSIDASVGGDTKSSLSGNVEGIKH